MYFSWRIGGQGSGAEVIFPRSVSSQIANRVTFPECSVLWLSLRLSICLSVSLSACLRHCFLFVSLCVSVALSLPESLTACVFLPVSLWLCQFVCMLPLSLHVSSMCIVRFF